MIGLNIFLKNVYRILEFEETFFLRLNRILLIKLNLNQKPSCAIELIKEHEYELFGSVIFDICMILSV